MSSDSQTWLNGDLIYRPNFLSRDKASAVFESLIKLPQWQSDVIKMFGKTIVTGRKVIWFGDDGCDYTYSGVRKSAVNWHPVVSSLRETVEEKIVTEVNSCLANLYHHGEEGMGWHSDNEPELGKQPIISVISLGAERRFKLKSKVSKEIMDLELGHGSLFVMKGKVQEEWHHSLPKTKKVKEPRISLTFRNIVK